MALDARVGAQIDLRLLVTRVAKAESGHLTSLRDDRARAVGLRVVATYDRVIVCSNASQ